jgi:hypothetical protein
MRPSLCAGLVWFAGACATPETPPQDSAAMARRHATSLHGADTPVVECALGAVAEHFRMHTAIGRGVGTTADGRTVDPLAIQVIGGDTHGRAWIAAPEGVERASMFLKGHGTLELRWEPAWLPFLSPRCAEQTFTPGWVVAGTVDRGDLGPAVDLRVVGCGQSAPVGADGAFHLVLPDAEERCALVVKAFLPSPARRADRPGPAVARGGDHDALRLDAPEAASLVETGEALPDGRAMAAEFDALTGVPGSFPVAVDPATGALLPGASAR